MGTPNRRECGVTGERGNRINEQQQKLPGNQQRNSGSRRGRE